MRLLIRLLLLLGLALMPALTVPSAAADEEEEATAKIEVLAQRPRTARLRTSPPRPPRHRPTAPPAGRGPRVVGAFVPSARPPVPPPLVC